MTAKTRPLPRPTSLALLAGALFAALAWSWWPAFEQMAGRWARDPQYTHGYIVPLLALIVLWFRRDRFPPAGKLRAGWLGVPVLLLGVAVRLVGSLYAYEWLEGGSLLITLAGTTLLLGGLPLLRWAWPVGVLLLFALPWPWQLDDLITYPLRRIATLSSTYLLQVLGLPALARGNIITINKLEVGVVEACSGLGMLMTFFALSTAIAFVMDHRPTFDRVTVFLSAVPVGILMNIVRITVTVFLYKVAGAELADLVFHDVAGWVMMPLALLVMWLELAFLSRLWLPVERPGPVPVSMGARRPVAPPRLAPTPASRLRNRTAPTGSLQEVSD